MQSRLLILIENLVVRCNHIAKSLGNVNSVHPIVSFGINCAFLASLEDARDEELLAVVFPRWQKRHLSNLTILRESFRERLKPFG